MQFSRLEEYFLKYNMAPIQDTLIRCLLRDILFSLHKSPAHKGLFSLQQIHEVSQLCEVFESFLTYCAAVLWPFMDFSEYKISHLLFAKAFDPVRHFFQSHVQSDYTRVYLKLKWAMNVQAPEKLHYIKLPSFF